MFIPALIYALVKRPNSKIVLDPSMRMAEKKEYRIIALI